MKVILLDMKVRPQADNLLDMKVRPQADNWSILSLLTCFPELLHMCRVQTKYTYELEWKVLSFVSTE